MEKINYKNYLDSSKENFLLPIHTDSYKEDLNSPFNYIDLSSEGILSINLKSLISEILDSIEDSDTNTYCYDYLKDLIWSLDEELFNYDISDYDLKNLYSYLKDTYNNINWK